jgi:hypothetical protein
MSLDGGRDQLAGAVKTLRGHWDQTDPYWQDMVKVQFVEEILTPLLEQAAAGLEAIDRMDVLLRRMQHDCEGTHVDILGSD